MMVGILQARASSSRLPGKVLKPILGQPMLARQIERVRRAKSLDALVLATSTGAEDDAVAAVGEAHGNACFRGSLDDVLDRFVGAARAHGARHVVRLTGDCPLADPAVIDAVVATYRAAGVDYASNTNPPTFPDGLDVEVVGIGALERAWREARRAAEREHVTLYIHQNPALFRLANHASARDLSAMRWTVDTAEDFAFVTAVFEALYPTNPAFSMADVLALLAQRPDLAAGNAHIARNAGLVTSLQKEQS